MKKIIFLFTLALLLHSHNTLAHHKNGHQNTEPEFQNVDCGMLNDFILLQKQKVKSLIHAMKQDPNQAIAIKKILPDEIEKLMKPEFIYNLTCKEV